MVKVSVLTWVYNGETHLPEAVESILGQTFNNFEFVIVDDASTGKTWEILSAYAVQDSRIVLAHNGENLGITKSANKALKLAQGEYIAVMDADDVSLPNRLESQVYFLDTHPEVGALGTAAEIIDRQGAFLRKNYLPTDHESLQALLLINNFMCHSTLMARRSLMQKLGGYNQQICYALDYDLWWRLSRQSNLATLPNILLRYRVGDDSGRVTTLNREEQLQTSIKISIRAVKESLGDSSLDEESYRRFWWAYLQLLDRKSYQRFWYADQGRHSNLTWRDIQRLQPFWTLLEKHPGGSSMWGDRLHSLANHLLRSRQTVEGMQLLWIVARKLKIPIQWDLVAKGIVKPFIPSVLKHKLKSLPKSKRQEKSVV